MVDPSFVFESTVSGVVVVVVVLRGGGGGGGQCHKATIFGCPYVVMSRVAGCYLKTNPNTPTQLTSNLLLTLIKCARTILFRAIFTPGGPPNDPEISYNL